MQIVCAIVQRHLRTGEKGLPSNVQSISAIDELLHATRLIGWRVKESSPSLPPQPSTESSQLWPPRVRERHLDPALDGGTGNKMVPKRSGKGFGGSERVPFFQKIIFSKTYFKTRPCKNFNQKWLVTSAPDPLAPTPHQYGAQADPLATKHVGTKVRKLTPCATAPSHLLPRSPLLSSA